LPGEAAAIPGILRVRAQCQAAGAGLAGGAHRHPVAAGTVSSKHNMSLIFFCGTKLKNTYIYARKKPADVSKGGPEIETGFYFSV
ncbi:hypothetical protein, partial [Methylomagnum sp.]